MIEEDEYTENRILSLEREVRELSEIVNSNTTAIRETLKSLKELGEIVEHLNLRSP